MLFVVLEKPIYMMVVLKTIFTIIGDLFLIPQFGVNGAAYSDIVVNSACVVLCLVVVFRERLIVISFKFDRLFIKDFLFIGLFSGTQILLHNLIYSALVCRMVNAVTKQGNYWIANNIIWGLLLIPILALAEIIRKDCRDQLILVKIKHYNTVIVVTFISWVCFIPMLNLFLKNVMGIEDYGKIRHILIILIPFYQAYNYTVLFDNILIDHGKIHYCFVMSLIVNLIDRKSVV